MLEKCKELFDGDTGKVMLALGTMSAADLTQLDAAAKLLTSLLAAGYIALKIWRLYQSKHDGRA